MRIRLFDLLRGRRPRHHADGTTMRSEQPSWILVEGSDCDTIRRAVIAHSGISTPEQPSQHHVKVFQVDASRFGVTFDPPAPPYAFANLINWLGDPEMTRGARRAAGWLVAPGDGARFFLVPDRMNAYGDTLVGISSNGRVVSVYLPDCSVTPSDAQVEVVPEPDLSDTGAGPVVAFEVTLDGGTSFGNPQFVVT